MTYTVPTLAQVADYSGRDESSYRSFIDSALRQATLMFVVATGLSEPPTDLVDLEIATYGILSMADEIYLAQPHAEASVGPFQSESIGSYSYSRRAQQQIIKGDRTGVSWFDLAVRRLRSAEDSQIFSGQVSIFENDNLYQRSSDGSLVVLGPRDMNAPSVAWSDSIEIPQSPTVIRGPRG